LDQCAQGIPIQVIVIGCGRGSAVHRSSLREKARYERTTSCRQAGRDSSNDRETNLSGLQAPESKELAQGRIIPWASARGVEGSCAYAKFKIILALPGDAVRGQMKFVRDLPYD
jgi:hypothetical protein